MLAMEISKTTKTTALWIVSALLCETIASSQESAEPELRDPASIKLIQVDLKNADSVLRAHDLDDNGFLNQTELERLKWSRDQIKRFDLNRNSQMQHLEIALKLADERMNAGIVQMDSVLADRYMKQYDSNGDNRLTMVELSRNSFTDAPESYDKNSDDELTHAELIRGIAFERVFRSELGIKGCDQGGAMKLIRRGDHNRDRQIDEDELQQAGLTTEAFKFDRNDDERLSVSELAECLADRRNRLGLNPSDQLAVRALLGRLDRDGNGLIAAIEIPPESANGLMTQYDGNKDGEITELELEQVFGNRRKSLGYDDIDLDRASTLVQRNDTDRNRSLSKSELIASGADRNSPLSPIKLAIIDTDKNGEVSIKELAKYLKKTR